MTTTTQPGTPPRNMSWIPGGIFLMGSDDFYPEEAPAHRTSVDGFWMDEHPVTVAEFRRFVKATGYVTFAERPIDPAAYPGADPRLLVPGSLVFTGTRGPVRLDDFRQWWAYVPGACWRHPEGPGSDTVGRDRHPVTHVAYEDAEAYATWAGKSLPTEAEWERAARGGLDGTPYAWGDELAPKGRHRANTWQGEFPWQNTREDGFERTSPVGSFPPNPYGLVDMIGNVWEWTRETWSPSHAGAAAASAPVSTPTTGAPAEGSPRPCCVPADARALPVIGADGPAARRVTKGGSHLCAPSYCRRYRPAARQGQDVDTSTSHIGFRCVSRRNG